MTPKKFKFIALNHEGRPMIVATSHHQAWSWVEQVHAGLVEDGVPRGEQFFSVIEVEELPQ